MLLKILTSSDKAKVVEYINKLPEVKQYTVEVKLKREKRSVSQNALYWCWLSCIQDNTGTYQSDLHEIFKQKFLSSQCRNVRLMDEEYTVVNNASTTKLDTKQMTDYLDRIQQFASSELGLILPNQDDLYWSEFYEQYKGFI